MMNQSYQGRAIIRDTEKGISIEIPVKRNWIVIVCFAIWLLCWLLGELYVLGIATGLIEQQLEEGLNGFFIFFWLVAWSLGGVYFIRLWLYATFGSELITMSQGTLKLEKKYALFDKPKTYKLALVRNFSINPDYRKDLLSLRRLQTLSFSAEGMIRFNYGPKIIFFGEGIERKEANYLINLMKEKPVW